MEHVRRGSGVIGAACVLLLVAGACGDDDAAGAGGGERDDAGPDTSAPADEPTTSLGPTPEVEPDPDVAGLSLALTEIARLNQPLALASRDGDDSLFVAEREGRVFRLAPDDAGDAAAEVMYAPDEDPLVDISDEVVLEGEQALGGMAFSPDGERVYLSYSAAPEGNTRIISYDYDDADQEVDESSRTDVLEIEQPYDTHNNGTIRFGPDGYLYIGMGDGGHVGDPHGFGQDTSVLLGAILRIDPEGVAGQDSQSSVGEDDFYEIPDDNPFVEGGDGEPEIWLYGVRNPWRFSFDVATGDLWIGDVGQETREEINHLPADDGGGRGVNLGWSETEGSQPFEDGSSPPDAVGPVFDYPNHREGGDGGCAVVGGHVYRGDSIDGLDGVYLFGDFCNSQIRALTVSDGAVSHHTPLPGIAVDGLVSIDAATDGELYLLSEAGAIYRIDSTD